MRRILLGLNPLLDRPQHPSTSAETVSVLGCSVPLRLTEDDDRRLETAALLMAPWERRVVVTGRDSARFLHSMLTQDVTGMPISSVRPTALADRKGHALLEGWLWREDESRFVLRISAPYVAVLLDVLERHRIMEKVEWALPPATTPFLVLGSKAGSVLGVEQATEAGCLPLFGDGACWMRVSETSPHDRVVFASIPEGSVAAWLPQALPIGWDAFDRARIEAGRAWMGIDVDAERLVPEPGWDDHISYTKGCYLGQETLARLHYQGRLNWRLARLGWPGAGVPRGTELRERGGARIGWITSVHQEADRCQALGFLHRRVQEESLPLTLPDDRPVASTSIAG